MRKVNVRMARTMKLLVEYFPATEANAKVTGNAETHQQCSFNSRGCAGGAI